MDYLKAIQEFQKSITSAAQQIFKTDKSLCPMIHFLFKDKQSEQLNHAIFPCGELMENHETKDKLVDIIKQAIKNQKDKKCLSVVMVTEAWVKRTSSKEEFQKVVKNGRIADLPDKEEIVMINYSNIIDEGCNLFQIDRTGIDPTLVRMESIDNAFNSGNLSGRFINLVEKELIN